MLLIMETNMRALAAVSRFTNMVHDSRIWQQFMDRLIPAMRSQAAEDPCPSVDAEQSIHIVVLLQHTNIYRLRPWHSLL
jgi:hypothetical protein